MDTFLTSEKIETMLKDAPYEPALGIRFMQLTTTPIDGKKIALIAIKLDKGKQLIPHLHEVDGEILFPLTKGLLRLGKASNKKDKEGKIVVEWDKPQELIPCNALTILPGIPHHITAPDDSDCMVLFFLPETHLSVDRKFVTYP